jgi:hypothetical protein
VQTLQSLDARLLVGADDVDALFREQAGLLVQVADRR